MLWTAVPVTAVNKKGELVPWEYNVGGAAERRHRPDMLAIAQPGPM